ncbi:hypothetical protein JXB41_06950 [Candidatus Woesearchaeota archaeon]|nr:hypothetical protein [Candidatus Woesearchaeota archaeon]
MDINKVQKLNQLAVNLKKHNIADSANDAVKQAENVFGTQNNFVTRHTSSSEEPDKIQEIERQIRNLGFKFQRNEERISSIVEKINGLIKEFNDLKSNPQVNKKIEAKAECRGSMDPNKPIDRNNIAPADVSVEKYFYFGKK